MHNQWLQGGGDPGYLAWDLERWRAALSSSEDCHHSETPRGKHNHDMIRSDTKPWICGRF